MAKYTKEELRRIFQSPFDREAWNSILYNLFRADRIKTQPELCTDPDDNEVGYYMGAVETSDNYCIGLFYYKVKSGSVAHRKAGLRNLVKRFLNQNWGEFDAAIVVFNSEPEWRLSFVCDIKELATAPRRFTFVFGEHDNLYRTAIDRFCVLQSGEASFAKIREAFSVDALNNDFFDEYRKRYADFVQYITGKRYVKEGSKWIERELNKPNYQFETSFGGDDKLVRDYIKKMFGRIVFLYFLQRKGWLGGNRHYMHDLFCNSDKKDDFLDSVLEPLFFEVLDEKPENRSAAARELPNSENIPYLNGGLFARDEIDERTCVFPEDYFAGLFDFLDSYNFTIDENDTDDAEIGIDPEMLGRIFENLLEDNKDKGAFYTPKEIVNYMCRESIIAYINGALPDIKAEAVRELVEHLNPEHLSPDELLKIRRKLQAVKICDPAIGSGAFPMGLVNLLSKLYVAMKADTDTSKMKRHIMEQSIYGVDIEKGAVDIARLRFWLAMIVEEKEPMPLPNLNFKIMQGNSLLEHYHNTDLSDLTKVGGQKCFFDSDNAERESLLADLRSYYNESDHNRRNRLFNSIINNVRRQLYDKGVVLPAGMDPSANADFFLWHTWFSDVFAAGGFDIIIGNPPYIQLQKSVGITAIDKKGKEYDVKLGDLYKDARFDTFEKTGDIYCLFYELGNKLLKKGGHLCYITSNKWMRAGYGKALRRYFSEATNPKTLIDFGGIQIFDSATVDTNILLFEKSDNAHSTAAVATSKQDKSILNNLSDFVQQNAVEFDFCTSDSWVILSPIELSIKRKIEAVGVPLKDWDIQINYGIKTGFNDAFIISTEKRNEILANCQTEDERVRTEALIRPILRGRDIKRYGYEWAGLWLIATFPSRHYDIEQYSAVKQYLLSFGMEKLEQTGKEHIINGEKIKARKKTNNKWFETQDSISYWADFDKPKLFYADITQKLSFAFSDKGMFCNNTTYFISSIESDTLRHIQKYLNSPLMNWYYGTLSVQLGESALRMFSIYVLQIPIPRQDIDKDEIYRVFELTDEEISFIESQYI